MGVFGRQAERRQPADAGAASPELRAAAGDAADLGAAADACLPHPAPGRLPGPTAVSAPDAGQQHTPAEPAGFAAYLLRTLQTRAN